MNDINTCMRTLVGFALALSLAFPGPALAADDHGHDHGGGAAQEAEASPRLESHSDLFELVGIVENGRMTVYLDRYATNEPVVGAKVEFEAGADKGVAAPQPDGTYLVELAALGKPGQIPFSFTVSKDADTDLLAGELVIEDEHADEETASPWAAWKAWAGWAVAGVLALVAAVLAVRGRSTRRTGVAA